MYFELKLGRLSAKIDLSYRITIVDDDSGVGKTRLFDAIRKYPGNRAKINSDMPLVACDTITQIGNHSSSIIVIDEDCECLQSKFIKETIKIMINSDNYFCVLTRENKLAELAYSVDAIFKLRSKNGILTLIPKYPDFYKRNSGYPIDRIMVEDSTTGFDFFSRLVKNCKSFKGKDNYERCFEGAKLGDLVIFDRIGFGSCIKDFCNLYLLHHEIQILDYDSFEGFLLNSMGIEYSRKMNTEGSLTDLLCTLLCQYGKTRNCDCLVNCKCCSSCNYHNFCLNSEQVFGLSKYKNYVNWR